MKRFLGFLMIGVMTVPLFGGCGRKNPPLPSPSPKPNIVMEGCEIHVLSLGKADCTLIIADGEAMLIDAGYQEQGNDIVSYLHDNGINTLKYAVVTHGDKDHVGGMETVLRNVETEQVLLSPRKENSPEYAAMVGALNELKIPHAIPKLLDRYSLGRGTFTILAPGQKALKADTDNDASIVLRLDYKQRSALFMGDALEKTEKEMRDAEYPLKADILKVGHHGKGDATTKKFLREVAPSYAVITCGDIINDTEDGYPFEEVIRRLNSFAVTTYRTDADGTIVFQTEGKKWQVQKRP